ncbi:MAG TPA: DUF1223 domain-containing protein [Calditrichia bacterium]|nr:DUF1223 domain-containing protein [Calditrichia bacterium]
MRFILFTFLISLSLSLSLAAQEQDSLTFSSGTRKVQLLELFSSQGCSSCPPAERWINRLKNDPALWKEVVPVVFHVDYWDRLGWKDPFADPAFTRRQYRYNEEGRTGRVYTPGFVVDGREWRGWFSGEKRPARRESAPELQGSWNGEILRARFDRPASGKLTLNVAILGLDLETEVTRGENRNRTLQQHFVVLRFLQSESATGRWDIKPDWTNLPKKADLAMALWVTEYGDLTPLQATGFALPEPAERSAVP